MRSKYIRRIGIFCVIFLILTATAIGLVYNGAVLLNQPSESEYPVRGVDVSAYQGTVDWQTLFAQNIDFAFIKATEGSSFVDSCFAYNCAEAQKQHLSVGVYHFFSYDSSGEAQARHYIDTVSLFDGMLPPVIDLEFYGDYEKNPPSRERVSGELQAMLDALEQHYGVKPIIYATEKSYALYLSGEYAQYDIWIRNVWTKPKLSDGREWTFWQFTNREQLQGYEGKEKYIDVNVFCGTAEEFQAYPRVCLEK